MSLTSEIKALLKKGDAANADTEKLYKAAGQKLIELRKDKSKAEFEKVVKKECGIGIRWAYVLMRLAKGGTTLAKLRAGVAKNVRKSRALRNAQPEAEEEDLPDDTPEQRWH